MAGHIEKKKEQAFANVSAGLEITNAWYADEIIDGKHYERITFLNCHFSGIGAKNTVFEGVKFHNCVFDDCYFHGSRFRSCKFVGCKFVRTVTNNSQFDKYCGMEYTRFYDSALTYAQVAQILPMNPSDSYRLLRNLAQENIKMGQWDQYDGMILRSIEERERYLQYILTGSNDYYRSFGFRRRLESGLKLVWSKVMGVVWGHGLKSGVLFRNIFMFSLLIGPLLVYLNVNTTTRSAAEFVQQWTGLILFTLQTSLPGASLFRDEAFNTTVEDIPRWLEVGFSLTGFVFFGMYLAVLQRSIQRGR